MCICVRLLSEVVPSLALVADLRSSRKGGRIDGQYLHILQFSPCGINMLRAGIFCRCSASNFFAWTTGTRAPIQAHRSCPDGTQKTMVVRACEADRQACPEHSPKLSRGNARPSVSSCPRGRCCWGRKRRSFWRLSFCFETRELVLFHGVPETCSPSTGDHAQDENDWGTTI